MTATPPKTTSTTPPTPNGPLELYAGRFAKELLAEGFMDLSTAEQLRLMGHLSRWLGERGMPAAALDGPTVEDYCRARREQGYTARLAPSGLGRLVGSLQGAGVVRAAASSEADGSPDDRLVVRYRRWLVEERALVEAVVAAWCKIARLFLGLHPGLSVGEATVGTGEVTRFCVQQFPGRSSSVARNMGAGLRTFLRFLHLQGLVAGPLAQAVPAAANRQGAGLPRFVAPGVVARLLAGCDRRTCRGRRDYAILLLLVRLGLRAGEVARLSIDDIDWQAAYAFGLRRAELCRLELADLRPNPHVAEWGTYGSVHVRHGKAIKGGVPRRRTVLAVPEFDWVIAGLRQWVEEARPILDPADHPALWVTERLTTVALKHFDKRFAWLRAEAGLDPALSLHCLRHSYVSHLKMSGVVTDASFSKVRDHRPAGSLCVLTPCGA
jgi:site-specific recombinase XerD